MKCLKCGHETNSESTSSGYVTETVIKCQNCGWTIVTTGIADIVDDITKYSIVVDSGNTVNKETIRIVAKVTGHNVLESKKILEDGGIILSEYAIKIIEIIPKLDIMDIRYHIEPEFPY